jgi:hypothetical protein
MVGGALEVIVEGVEVVVVVLVGDGVGICAEVLV